jgi:DNA-binding response OmpR family regulator
MAHRVLIVEDEPNIVVSLEFLLDHEGYEVQVATSGPEALERSASFRPDLVLLDVMLPGLDGFEVCRALRAQPDSPKIILLTARGRDAERHKGLDLGADLYVTKPFSTRQLMADIRDCLGFRDA